MRGTGGGADPHTQVAPPSRVGWQVLQRNAATAMFEKPDGKDFPWLGERFAEALSAKACGGGGGGGWCPLCSLSTPGHCVGPPRKLICVRGRVGAQCLMLYAMVPCACSAQARWKEYTSQVRDFHVRDGTAYSGAMTDLVSAATAAKKNDEWFCANGCGFKGTYKNVEEHEKTCTFVRAPSQAPTIRGVQRHAESGAACQCAIS